MFNANGNNAAALTVLIRPNKLGQNQNVFNQNGGNVAFSSGVLSNVKPVQKADNVNTVNVFSGGTL